MSQDQRKAASSDPHDIDPAALVTREFWDGRYASTDQVWSGNPNQRLVEHAADLAPGSALEVGCGEGADAIWLASRGWHVTAVDVSPVALKRAAGYAAEAGSRVVERIVWQEADILAWQPEPRQYDLVTAHFIHVPADEREPLHRRLSEAVRPGGTLLIVGHHRSDLETLAGRWRLAGFMFTQEQIAAVLAPEEWDIIICAAPERAWHDPDGQPVTIRDAVLRAKRRN